MVIGLRLKEARILKDLTQQELGKIVGVSKTSICLYEKCQKTPSLKVFEKLAKALDVSPEYLMGDDLGIKDSEPKIFINISKQDLAILSVLKKYKELYIRLYNDYKRTIKLMDIKLKDMKIKDKISKF